MLLYCGGIHTLLTLQLAYPTVLPLNLLLKSILVFRLFLHFIPILSLTLYRLLLSLKHSAYAVLIPIILTILSRSNESLTSISKSFSITVGPLDHHLNTTLLPLFMYLFLVDINQLIFVSVYMSHFCICCTLIIISLIPQLLNS